MRNGEKPPRACEAAGRIRGATRQPSPPRPSAPQPRALAQTMRANSPNVITPKACVPRPFVPRQPQPPPRPAAFQPKMPTPHAPRVAAQLRTPTPQRPHAPPVVARPAVVQRATVRAPSRRVVQAIKLYPNLHPGAVEKVDASSLFRLENFTDQYRLRKTDSHGVYVPNQQYNFVRTGDGTTLLHNRYRHPSIAEGRQVLYAGEAFFNNGKLEWWSNGSGHYQPDADDAAQAALPLGNFYTYQQIIKGEHKRKRG